MNQAGSRSRHTSTLLTGQPTDSCNSAEDTEPTRPHRRKRCTPRDIRSNNTSPLLGFADGSCCSIDWSADTAHRSLGSVARNSLPLGEPLRGRSLPYWQHLHMQSPVQESKSRRGCAGTEGLPCGQQGSRGSSWKCFGWEAAWSCLSSEVSHLGAALRY
jgi:hypothetical protein